MKFMRHIFKLLMFSFISIGTTALFSCRNDNGAKELAHHHEHNHIHEHNHENERHELHDHGLEHSEEEEDAIVISPEKAERLGISSIEVSENEFRETIKVSAEILASASDSRVISAKSSGIVSLLPTISEGLHVNSGQTVASVSRKGMPGGDAAEGARLEYEAAKREYERLKPLFEKGVVSAKDFNEARSIYEQTEAALSGSKSATAGTSAVSPIAGTISAVFVKSGDYVEAGDPIANVMANTSMRLHADLPRRMLDDYNKIISATIVIPETGNTYDLTDLKGRRLAGDAIECAQHPGYMPVFFSFESDGRLTSGGYVDAYLKLAGQHNAVTVPVEALSEQQGKWFVYIQLDEDCYEKRPVERGGTDGHRVEIISGVKPGEYVVSEGVTYVKLAESVGIVPEGHSHSH